MRVKTAAFLLVLALPGASFAREGTPSYYNNNYNAGGYQQVASAPGQQVFVGDQVSRKVVGQRSYAYQVPRAADPSRSGAMTPNGVAIPSDAEKYTLKLSAEYARKFADFQFSTGVQSVLEWDNMVVEMFGVRAEKLFNIRDYNILAFGEYATGKMTQGGLSMDYDLKPYDNAQPTQGVFTISMGDQSGKMQNMKLGIAAKNIWDLGGWKISPTIGYQIFKHDMQMSNHIYPNPAVYIPLMNQYGDYIYGDESGNYYSVAQGVDPGDGYYQVCMSPEDLMLAASDPNTHAPVIDTTTGELITTPYDPLFYDMYLPWGVGPGECVVIGGDGIIKVDGITHIYNTTWSGIYLGVEVEKQMTYVDRLRFYAQVSKPHYRSEGTWPNRTDWQQNPSFLDEGDNGSMHYEAEMEYIYKFSDRLELSVKGSLEYFHIGKVGGDLYVAGYNYYRMNDDGTYALQDTDGDGVGDTPILDYQEPYTEKISDSLRNAIWQSYGLHFGVKYAF